MKNFFISFALFTALIFVLSCGNSSKTEEKTDDKTDTGETSADKDAYTEPEDSDSDADTGETESAEAVECNDAGGTWNYETETCTRKTKCEPLSDKHAEWNGESSYTQTYADGEWSAENTTEYSTDEGICHFKCASGYEWNGSACIYDGSSQISLPECGAKSTVPCYDSSTGYIWSGRKQSLNWTQAVSYCDNLSQDGIEGWHLPNINELRTLVLNCPDIMPGGICLLHDPDCIERSCWSASTCEACSYDESTGYHTGDDWGGYSKFQDTENLWSSSVESQYGSIWVLDFHIATITPFGNGNYLDLRCVKHTIPVGKTRERSCQSKPANTVWNTVDTITQTYNGEGWEPTTEASYNPEASETECRYKCAEGYEWNGNSCTTKGSSALPECSASSGTPCRDSSTGYVWSERSPESMNWEDAKSYCGSYSEKWIDGWKLPNIDELKTLLIADRVQAECLVSEVNHCLSNSCWTCSTCTQTATLTSDNVCLGSPYDDGRYSKFGETGDFWSSSANSQTNGAWGITFDYGDLIGWVRTGKSDVRCMKEAW